MKNIITLSFIIFILSSCSTGMQPISYGHESCSFCKMTIMDKRFGTEIMSKKSKAIKFDAIECMMAYVKASSIKPADIDKYYVTNISQPGILVEADQACYLESNKLNSPMGGNLCATGSLGEMNNFIVSFPGERLQWSDLLKKYAIL